MTDSRKVGDPPGTHFRNLIAARVASEYTVSSDISPKTYKFENISIKSRFNLFSYTWSSLAVLLMILVLVYMIRLISPTNKIYGISPTDRLVVLPKIFKSRIRSLAIVVGVLFGLLCGILAPHTSFIPSYLPIWGLILLFLIGCAGVLITVASPKADDSDIREFYTARQLGKVADSAGWVIRCIFLSASIFLIFFSIFYGLTQFMLDNYKNISNLDTLDKLPGKATDDDELKQFYIKNRIFSSDSVQRADSNDETYGVRMPFYGAGPAATNSNNPHPSVHQMRFGFLTFVTPKFVNSKTKQVIKPETTYEKPNNRMNWVAVAMDLLIPILLICVLWYLQSISNILSVFAYIMGNIDSEQKKKAFQDSKKGLLWIGLFISLIIYVLLLMWALSALCCITWVSKTPPSLDTPSPIQEDRGDAI